MKHCAKSASLTSRDSALHRHQAVKRGLFGRTIADIARARAKISETELQIATLDVNAQSEILKEREAIESELAQLTASACAPPPRATLASTSAPATTASYTK